MNGRERRSRGRYSEWPHMTTLYNSNSRINEAGNSNDVPLSTIDNSFEPPNPLGYFRYHNGQRNDTLDSVISEGINSSPSSLKREKDGRASSYEIGDKFKRGSTCRVILCIFFVLCFIGVVIAGVVLSVLLSQRILPKKVSKTFESTATLNNATFTEALTDINSPQFHQLATEFCEAMKAMFTSSSSPFNDDYEDCEVLSFSPGSVKVRFRIGSKIYSEVNMETILGQFKNHLQTMITRKGPWNPLRIDETTIFNFKEVDPQYRIKYSSQFKTSTEDIFTENLSSRYIKSSIKEKKMMSSQNSIVTTDTEKSSSLDIVIEELKQITRLNQMSLSILDSTKVYESYIAEYMESKTYIPSTLVLNSLVSTYTYAPDYQVTPSISEEVSKTAIYTFNDEISKSKSNTGLTMLYSAELSTGRFKMPHKTTYSDTIRTSIVFDKLSDDLFFTKRNTEKQQLEYMESETHSLHSSHETKLHISPNIVVTNTLMYNSDSSVVSMLPTDLRQINASQLHADTSSVRGQSLLGLEDLNIFATKYPSSDIPTPISGLGHPEDFMSPKASQVKETVNNNIQVYSDNVTRTFNQSLPHLQYHTTTSMYIEGSSRLAMLSSLSSFNTPVNVNTSDNFDFVSSKRSFDADEFRKTSVSSTQIFPDETMSLKADNSMNRVVTIEKSVIIKVEPSSIYEFTSSMPELITNSTLKYTPHSALPLNKTTRYLSTTFIVSDPSSPLIILSSSDIYTSVTTTPNLETIFVDMLPQRIKTDIVTKMEQNLGQSSMPYLGSTTKTANNTLEFSFDESTYSFKYMQQVVNETSSFIAFQSSYVYKQDSLIRLPGINETKNTRSFSGTDISYSTQELRTSSAAEIAEDSYVYVSPDTLLSEYRNSIPIDAFYSSHPDTSSDHKYLQSFKPMFSTVSEKSLVTHVSSEVQFSSYISTFSADYSDSSDIMRNIGSSLISTVIDPSMTVPAELSISKSIYSIRPNITKSPITEKPYVTKLKTRIENEIFLKETSPVDDFYFSKMIIIPQKEQVIPSQTSSKQSNMTSSKEIESQQSLIPLENQRIKSLTLDSVDNSAVTEIIFNSQFQSQIQEHISFVDSMKTLAVENSILLEQTYNKIDFYLSETVNTTLSIPLKDILSHTTNNEKPTNMYIEPTSVLKPTANVDKLFATGSVIFESLNSNSSKLFLSGTRPVPKVIRTTNVLTSYINEHSSVLELKTSADSLEFAFMTSFTDILPQPESEITDHFDGSLLLTDIITSVLNEQAENNTSNTFTLTTLNSSLYHSLNASILTTASTMFGPMLPMTILAEPISEESFLIEPVDTSILSEEYVSSKAVNAHSSIENKESSNKHSVAFYSSWTNPQKSSLLFADILTSKANNLQPVVFTPSFYSPSNKDLYTTFSNNEDTELVDVYFSSLIENEILKTKFQTSDLEFTTTLLQSTYEAVHAMEQLFPSESFTASHVSDNNLKATPTIADTIYSTEKDLESNFDYVETTSITLNKGLSIKEGNQTTKFVLKSTQLAVRDPVENDPSTFVVASQYDNIPSIRSYGISSSDFPSKTLSLSNSIDQKIEGTTVSKVQMVPDITLFSSITKANISYIPTDYYTYSHDAIATSSITSNTKLSINGNILNNTASKQTLNTESKILPSNAFSSLVQKEETFKTKYKEINMNSITPSQIQNFQENVMALSSVFAVNAGNQIKQKTQTASIFTSAIRTSDVVLSNNINMHTTSIQELTFTSASAIDINISSSKLAQSGIISQNSSTQDVVTSSITNVPTILPHTFYDTQNSLSPTYHSSTTREINKTTNPSSTSQMQKTMATTISLINSTLSAEHSEQHDITSSIGNFRFNKNEESDFLKIVTQPASHTVIDTILSNVSASKQRVVDVVSTKQPDVNDTYWIKNEYFPMSTRTNCSPGYLSTYVYKTNETMVINSSDNTKEKYLDEISSTASQSDHEKNKTTAISNKIITTEILKTSLLCITDISITETVDDFHSTSITEISVTKLHPSTLFLTSLELDSSEYDNRGSSIYPLHSIPSISVLSASQAQDNIPGLRFLDTTP
ncbi:unnamed protein product [Mytilus coruscus]|uniref:SEA domain-containing protein n=1 Tax=Mytilus coruscus TaxID=42192 RepID=A0A6J8EI58_MYTCO|nr:unnamed protein product [Mytilus coruscus]